MGVIVNKQNDDNNELSRRINADLRAKALETAGEDGGKKDVDFAEDSEYLKNLKKSSKTGWFWIILILLAIASILYIVFM